MCALLGALRWPAVIANAPVRLQLEGVRAKKL
jgi:hypothetical protein